MQGLQALVIKQVAQPGDAIIMEAGQRPGCGLPIRRQRSLRAGRKVFGGLKHHAHNTLFDGLRAGGTRVVARGETQELPAFAGRQLALAVKIQRRRTQGCGDDLGRLGRGWRRFAAAHPQVVGIEVKPGVLALECDAQLGVEDGAQRRGTDQAGQRLFPAAGQVINHRLAGVLHDRRLHRLCLQGQLTGLYQLGPYIHRGKMQQHRLLRNIVEPLLQRQVQRTLVGKPLQRTQGRE